MNFINKRYNNLNVKGSKYISYALIKLKNLKNLNLNL